MEHFLESEAQTLCLIKVLKVLHDEISWAVNRCLSPEYEEQSLWWVIEQRWVRLAVSLWRNLKNWV